MIERLPGQGSKHCGNICRHLFFNIERLYFRHNRQVFTYTNDSVDVYVTAPACGVVYWKNGEEIYLEGTPGNSEGAYGIAVSDINVYVGGYTNFITFPGFRAGLLGRTVKNAHFFALLFRTDKSTYFIDSDLYLAGSEESKPAHGVVRRLILSWDAPLVGIFIIAQNGRNTRKK